MNAREAKAEYDRRNLTLEELFDLLDRQEKTINRLEAEISRLRQRLAQYEPEVTSGQDRDKAQRDNTTNYSLQAEEKRRLRRKRNKKRKKSPGRRRTELKFADAERYVDIFPPGVKKSDCQLSRERAVWRLEEGKAVLIGYRIHRAAGGAEPRIPGVTPRCEYGIEILVVLAFLVYIIGISQRKACSVLSFFCQLPLSASQADALLRQLAREWDEEFESLCDMIARAAVVYMDETGWKVGKEGCSLWVLATKCIRVFVFGCRKDDETLDTILPPEIFSGIGVSDDAGVYRRRFPQGQKCWAHLLRKAIRLALLYPENKLYQSFLDRLLQLFYDAKKIAADARLSTSTRKDRVFDLETRLCELCEPYWRTSSDMRPDEREFANLANELLDRMIDEELFTFVVNPDVEPTNNLSERLLRGPARDRDAGRTSKSTAGARRRSVILSVLESLRATLSTFTLASVLDEVNDWMQQGISRFRREWQQFQGNCVPRLDTG